MINGEADFAAELTRALRARERSSSFARVRPKRAASLILLDMSEPEPKILLGKRHDNQRFMPGAYVFPGGRVERADRGGGDGGLHQASLVKLAAIGVSEPQAHALALAARRETFEETGVRVDGALHFVARAITPPRTPMRFDTFFFACDAQNTVKPAADRAGPEAEFVRIVWASARQALAMPLPLITSVVLREVSLRVAAGFKPDWPTPVYRVRRSAWSRVAL